MKTARGTSEDTVVRALRALFEHGAAGRVARVGIGDDAAVLRRIGAPLVWTVDTSVDGVHFRRDWLSLSEIGARSFHAAVSDLAAMGAVPVGALSNITLPKAGAARAIFEIARGQAAAARSLRCPVIGGNLSHGGELSVTTTVLGTARRPLLREGAAPGDELWLVGEVGLAGAGREWLASPRRGRGAPKAAVARAVEAFRAPRARIQQGLGLIGRAHAAMDISDGLAVDARRLADASGVRLLLDERALVSTLPRELGLVAELLGRSPVTLALFGGEDYALLATGRASRRPRWAHVIGRVEKGRGAFLLDERGRKRRLSSGFDHFTASR